MVWILPTAQLDTSLPHVLSDHCEDVVLAAHTSGTREGQTLSNEGVWWSKDKVQLVKEKGLEPGCGKSMLESSI